MSYFIVEDGDDDFEKLRKAREKERQMRNKFKLSRSISIQPASTFESESNVNKIFSTEDLVPSLFKACIDINNSASKEESMHSISSDITITGPGEMK